MLEIIDEAGNHHGPFATKAEAAKYAEERGLGDECRDEENDRAGGWHLEAIRTIG